MDSLMQLHKWKKWQTLVRHTVGIIRRHPLMPDNVAVHGLVIHPATGKLNLVVDGKTGSAA